jgi:hypothetical protein
MPFREDNQHDNYDDMPCYSSANNRKKKKAKISLVSFLLILIVVAVLGELILFVAFSGSVRRPPSDASYNNVVSNEILRSNNNNSGVSFAFGTRHQFNNDNRKDDFIVTSHVHCVGDNFLSNAWLFRSCHYRNLCWNGNLQEWVLFPSNFHQRLDQEWINRFGVTVTQPHQQQQKDHNGTSVARMSTTFREGQLLQSTIGMRPWWRRQQPSKFTWHPRVILFDKRNSSLLTKHFSQLSFFPNDTVVIPISVVEQKNTHSQKGESVLTLLMDSLYPIHQLIELFGFGKHQVYLHILNRRQRHNDSSHFEDDDDDCSDECQIRFQKAVRWMGYQIWEPPLYDNNKNDEIVTCAPFAASGIGKLTASGLSWRGHKVQDFQIPNNVGRGGAFWNFRNHILSHMPGSNSEVMKSLPETVMLALGQEHQKIFSTLIEAIQVYNNEMHARNQAMVTVETLNASFHGNYGPENLIRMAEKTKIWIASSHAENLTWPALFMTRNASLILLYDESLDVPRKRKDSLFGPVRQDFGLWNHMSHLKTHWLSLQHDTRTLVNIILQLIQNESVAPGDGKWLKENSSAMTFSGFPASPVSLLSLSSRLHCIGENWQWDAPNYRSCKFESLCFDIASRQFVAPQHHLRIDLPTRQFDILATDPRHKAVVRGENVRIGNGKLWFPNYTAFDHGAFYRLPNDIVLLPMSADLFNMKNPGHLLWDFWLPVYNLLQLFGHENAPLLLGFDFQDKQCPETTKHESLQCLGKLALKYLPLLGVDPATAFSTHSVLLSSPMKEKGFLEGGTVCANTGLAGVGMLTDHGFKTHGQQLDDYKVIWNTGRGPFFWKFRQFVLDRLMTLSPSPHQCRVTFSINSSNNPSRRRDFSRQIQMIRYSVPGCFVETVELGRLSLEDQLQAILDSRIFVSVVGGSVSTAMFLRRDACLILFYNDKDDFVRGTSRMPTMMDFDFWNNASYLRVHWLPISTMDLDDDIRILRYLIKSCGL